MSRTRIENGAAQWRRRPLDCIAASAVALSASLLSGCADKCLDNSAFYEQKVWTQVVSKNCLKCHAPEGVAANKNAKFIQLSQSFPGFLDINLANRWFVEHRVHRLPVPNSSGQGRGVIRWNGEMSC